jgi:hypothetical protein
MKLFSQNTKIMKQISTPLFKSGFHLILCTKHYLIVDLFYTTLHARFMHRRIHQVLSFVRRVHEDEDVTFWEGGTIGVGDVETEDTTFWEGGTIEEDDSESIKPETPQRVEPLPAGTQQNAMFTPAAFHLRDQFWTERDSLIGKIVDFEFLPGGNVGRMGRIFRLREDIEPLGVRGLALIFRCAIMRAQSEQASGQQPTITK